MESASAPVDVFRSHRASIQTEIEVSVESLADHCRDVDIISTQLHQELVLVTDTPVSKQHKAKKLVTAISHHIEAQSVQPVDQDHCALRRFIGALRKDSHEDVAELLETSLTGAVVSQETEKAANSISQETEKAANSISQKTAFTSPARETETEGADNPTITYPEDQGDPLDELISKDNINEIGKELPFWMKWARELKLTDGQIHGIECDPNLDYEMKGQKMLYLWRNSRNATYRTLCKVGIKINYREKAEWICKLVNGDWSSVCPSIPPVTHHATSTMVSAHATTTMASAQASVTDGPAETVYSKPVVPFAGTDIARNVMSYDDGGKEQLSKVSDLNEYAQAKLEMKEQKYIEELEKEKTEKELLANQSNFNANKLEIKEKELENLRKQKKVSESKLLNRIKAATAKNEKLREKIKEMKHDKNNAEKIIEQLTKEKKELKEKLEKFEKGSAGDVEPQENHENLLVESAGDFKALYEDYTKDIKEIEVEEESLKSESDDEESLSREIDELTLTEI